MTEDVYSVGEAILAEKRRLHRATDQKPNINAGPDDSKRLPRLTAVECPNCGAEAGRDGLGRIYCLECRHRKVHAEFLEAIVRKRLSRAGLDVGPLARLTLGSFDRTDARHWRAFDTIVTWLEGWPYSDGASVLLWSSSYGAGKTHLARATQRALVERGATVCFMQVADLLEVIRASYEDGAEQSEHAILWKAQRVDLLILDDLGKEYVADRSRQWFHNLIFRIVDRRYREGAPTFVTSNVAPTEFEALLGGATASRLAEMVGERQVDMTGADWRLR